MSSQIIVVYHGLFSHGNPRTFRPRAFDIVGQAMGLLKVCGLADAAFEIWTCFNGPNEEAIYASMLVPEKAKIVMHGPDSFAENLTVVKAWELAQANPNALLLYFHAKGATHEAGSSYGENVSRPWRETMLGDLVMDWRTCVSELENGPYDIVCSHWMWNMADGTQHIPAGNFLWARASFVASLPSIYERERIKISGIASAESRFEAEVFWGNGRRPIVKEMRPGGGAGVP